MRKSSRFLIAGFILSSFFYLQSCGGGGGGSSTTTTTTTTTTSLSTGNVLALVVDSNGKAVSGASLGGNSATTDSNGVAIGTVTATASGWVEITAPGYATGYAKQSGNDYNGKKLFDAVLTPAGDTVIHKLAAADTISVSDGTNIVLEATLATTLFSVDDVTVNLASIAQFDVGPLFEALNPADATMFLQKAFWLDAKDSTDADVSFASGQTVTVTVRDDGALTVPVTMASFNSVTGKWDVSSSTCSRSDANNVDCTISAAGLYGLFDTTAPTFTKSSYKPDSGQSARAAPDATGTAYKNAGAQYGCVLAGRCSSPTQEIAELELATAALNYAAAHMDERGKMRLISTQVLIESFNPSTTVDLMPSAIIIWNKLVSDLLATNPDCPDLDELKSLEAQKQAFLAGYSAAQESALLSKIAELEEKCKLYWEGTVHYTFLLENTYPLLQWYKIWPSSQRVWNETHNIFMAVGIDPVTGVSTGVLAGQDFVAVTLLPVMYRWDEIDFTTCGDDYTEIDMPQISAGNVTVLNFDLTGTYDGTTFAIDTPIFDAANSSNIVIKRRDYDQFWDEQPCFLNTFEQTITTVDGYKGMLGGGFVGAAEAPDLTTMLNTGTKTTDGDIVTITGTQTVTPNLPPVVYPFTKALLKWQFKNTSITQ